MPTSGVLDGYNASRDAWVDRSVLCHAPFVSLNFDQTGQVTACCYNRRFVLGRYPQESLREIWTGGPARELRDAFLKGREAPGCNLCFHQLSSGNFGGTLMRSFDRYGRAAGYRPAVDPVAPRVLELEISNVCNLECTMCEGHWSSAIRARREKLPPLSSPYGETFVDELSEFLPTIEAARFLGGEPFLIKRYYQIWERIRRSNPSADLMITTNGTLLPPHARELLEELRAHIVVSLDAVDPLTFETIRRNARFDQVMANFEYFADYTRRRGTSLAVAACPMTGNWRELPSLLSFCERRGLPLHFNTVIRPPEASLAGLSVSELEDVIRYLDEAVPRRGGGCSRGNRQSWDGLLSQLRAWSEDKRKLLGKCAELERGFRSFASPRKRDGWETPAGFDRLAGPLARSLGIARERARRGGEQWGLRSLAPRGSSELASEGHLPSAQHLLLAAHLLCLYQEVGESGDRASIDSHAVMAQQSLLRDYLKSEGQDPLWEGKLAAWISERIRKGEGDQLVFWTRTLLNALERPEGWRRGLEEGLRLLRSRGISEEALREVAATVEGSFAPFVPMLREEAPSPHRAPDLELLLDAMFLFHCCRNPSGDHAAFRRRLDACLSFLDSAGKKAEALRALETTGLFFAFELLSKATEEELAGQLSSLR